MGFVRDNYEIEGYFDSVGTNWRRLNDSEYKSLMKKWRDSFEELLLSGYRKYGDEAVLRTQDKLGVGMYVFNAPNCSFLPNTSSHYNYTYAYYVDKLHSLDRELFDNEEAILCDEEFTFMCAFNHEGMSLIPETYCEIEQWL